MPTHEVETLLNITKQTLIYYEIEEMIYLQRDQNNYRNCSSQYITRKQWEELHDEVKNNTNWLQKIKKKFLR